MSTNVGVRAMVNTATPLSWTLWLRQSIAILKLEAKKNFLGKRALLLYLMAGAPIFLTALIVTFHNRPKVLLDAARVSMIFAGMFENLILRTIVFFGCAWIFMNLFRGDMIDRSLHYYFLAPVRREVLLAGKYFSGLLTSIILFVSTTLGTMMLFYSPRGYEASMQHIFQGPGLKHIASYIGIVVLGCIGYGAIFLTIGLFFRNPIIPAVLVYGWEFINFLLPPLLKKISITHYLQSLSPVPLPEGPFALVAEPTPAYLAVPGLIIFSALVLTGAALRIRRMEINYGSD